MAYTRAWDETKPVGATTQASDIDLVIQQLKQDIRERMNSIIPDFTVDPVVPSYITYLTTGNLSTTSAVLVSLASVTLPANALPKTGSQLIITVTGLAANATNSITIKLGSTSLTANTLATTQQFEAKVTVIRTGTATKKWTNMFTVNGIASTVTPNTGGTEDFTTALLLDFQFSIGGANTYSVDTISVVRVSV